MPRQSLQWEVAGFEDGCAVLKANGQALKVPRAQLPDTAKVGDVVTAEFYFVKDEAARKANLARAILEEILGKNSS